jgi:hypothetical protein
MVAETYYKGTWKAETHVEELASGKFQGVVLLFNQKGESKEQIMHRALDVSDTIDGALAEANVLAKRILDEL